MVVEEIKRDIIHGHLEAGEKLITEKELSDCLAAGHPAIREALRITEEQGWIRLRFGKGDMSWVILEYSRNPYPNLQGERSLELLAYEISRLEKEGEGEGEGEGT